MVQHALKHETLTEPAKKNKLRNNKNKTETMKQKNN